MEAPSEAEAAAEGSVPARNKARSGSPGRLSAQPWCRPSGVRAQLRVWFGWMMS